MVGELPDFRLEVYLGQWEFAARHHLTASLLPAEIYASALGDVPRAHFRIGVGRHGTAEALAAVEQFLASSS